MQDDNDSLEFIDKLKQYISKYKNPPNHQEISDNIRECKTIGDVKNLVDKTFPEWFVTLIPRYSTDYSTLQTNWINCCKKAGVPTAQIMIVEDIEEGTDYSLIGEFTECFASAGFQVRRKQEFIPCCECGNAIASINMHSYMVEKGLPVVEKWSEKCTTC